LQAAPEATAAHRTVENRFGDLGTQAGVGGLQSVQEAWCQ
jgi:hypothetical protein